MAKSPNQQQPDKQRSDPPTEAVTGKLFVSFAVAFKRIGVFLPIIAAAMTLLFYFFYPDLLISWQMQYLPKALGGFLILIDGLLSALLIALVYALCSMPFVALTNRGMQDYVPLEIREKKLRARLGNPIFENGVPILTEDEMTKRMGFPNLKQDVHKLAAYREAYNTYLALYENLYFPKGVQLLSNVGDVYAWGMANSTQEALIEIEAMPRVIDEAKQVYAAIQASSMNDRNELLKELAQAISVLDPQATEGLHEDKSEKQFNNLRKDLHVGAIPPSMKKGFFRRVIRALHTVPEVRTVISNHSLSLTEEEQMRDRENTGNSQPASEAETRIRVTIRTVSSRLHAFQQDRLAGVLQARNNLVLSTLASGLITYALLCASIIAMIQQQNPNSPPSITITVALASAVLIYTTGVAAGLFGRLYAEANKESAAKDYGLSRARLQAIPLISGLAAIGGVFITTTTLAATNESTVLMSAFTLNVRNILVAMIFGFAPNLLIRGFQRHSDQYASDLESTRGK